MSDENLKPLSFDDDEVLKPISFETSNNTPSDFVPLANANTNEIKNKDSNFIFFFGVSASGKSVILSAILYYLRTKAPVTAQKFTIDPRMLVTTTNESEDDKKKRERKELLDKLASEYEEEQKKAKEAAEAGDGCLFCSA